MIAAYAYARDSLRAIRDEGSFAYAEPKTKNPAKLADVVTDDGEMMCERDRGNLQIQWANRHTVLFQIGANSPIHICCKIVE